jgi:hypothetical protein
VRGRLSGPPSLRVRIDDSDSPLAPGVLAECVREAVTTWNATGLVELSESTGSEDFDVLYAWRRGAHDNCIAFGYDTSVAHAGPVSEQSFVHIDADRGWSKTGADGLPLAQVVLHELGHVFGLGHSLDEAAVMHANYDARRDEPALSDLAGLASLYGGLDGGPGDLFLTKKSGVERASLVRRIAPVEHTGFALWDVNDNGRDELLVWRTDPASYGRLMIYHFDSELRLESTSGPLLDCVVPTASVVFGEDSAGEGVLLSILAEARYSARRFQEGVYPKPLPHGTPLALKAGFADLDGDGVLDVLPLEWESQLAPNSQTGDLDGDGSLEKVATF